MPLIEDLVREVPPITRIMCGISIILTFICYLEYATPYDMYFNWKIITTKYQIWRIVTNFLYFGDLSISTAFRVVLLYRFSRRLEEHSFKGVGADYLFFLLIGFVTMIIAAIFIGIHSLSDAFLTLILYLWSRRNENMFLHIFGLLPVRAPYITWFFVFLQLLIGEGVENDLLGIGIGHFYYFFEDIYGKLPLSTGVRVLKTPQIFFKFANVLHLNCNPLLADPDLIQDPGQGAALF